jgi:hypothetical protein
MEHGENAVKERNRIPAVNLMAFAVLAIATLGIAAASDLSAPTTVAMAADTTAAPGGSASAMPAPSTSPSLPVPSEAHIVVSGSINTELTLPFVPSGAFPTGTGSYELQWQDAGLNTLNVTLDMAGGALTSAFVAVGVPGTSIYDTSYFADFFRSQCQVAVTRLEEQAVEGTLACPGLKNADDTATVDVTGEFSARAPLIPTSSPPASPMDSPTATASAPA